jgi:hypothetical protein
MPPTVIARAADADAAWLTGVLRAGGALAGGEVVAVAAEHLGGTWSQTIRLRPRYGAGAAGPASLVLKLVGGDHAVFDRSEVDYYTRDYAGLAVPLPRCHHAAYREAPRGYHLLLDDLAPSHDVGWDAAPARWAAPLADAVARLHAARWGEPSLAAIGAARPERAALTRYLDHVQGGLAPLLDLTATTLPPGWRAALVTTFDRLPDVLAGRAAGPLTLIHGDLNPGNLLVARDPTDPHPLYLIDRQPFDWSLRVWTGAWDLAYPMVLFWEPAERRRWQDVVLDRYRRGLADAGIAITAADLRRDYQLAIAQCLAHAVEWLVVPADRTEKRWLWELQLARAMDAYAEQGCAALWT